MRPNHEMYIGEMCYEVTNSSSFIELKSNQRPLIHAQNNNKSHKSLQFTSLVHATCNYYSNSDEEFPQTCPLSWNL